MQQKNMTVNQFTSIKPNVTTCIDLLKQNLKKIENLILRNRFYNKYFIL